MIKMKKKNKEQKRYRKLNKGFANIIFSKKIKNQNHIK